MAPRSPITMPKVSLAVDMVGCNASASPSLLKYHSSTYLPLVLFCFVYSNGWGDSTTGTVTPWGKALAFCALGWSSPPLVQESAVAPHRLMDPHLVGVSWWGSVWWGVILLPLLVCLPGLMSGLMIDSPGLSQRISDCLLRHAKSC